MKQEIPTLFKQTSTYIKSIEKYDDFVISQTVQKLVATKSFWEMAVNRTELIPLSISENPKVSAKQLQKQNNECLEMVRKKLGSEKFAEYANPESEICIKSAEEKHKHTFFYALAWQEPDNWFKNFFKAELDDYSEAELAFIIRFINTNGFGKGEFDIRTKKVPQKKSKELQVTALNNIKSFLGTQKFSDLQNTADEICIELTNEFNEWTKNREKVLKWHKSRKAKEKAHEEAFERDLRWKYGGGKETFDAVVTFLIFLVPMILFAMWLWSYDSNPGPSCEKFYSKTLNREMCI
ncbi:hypothetical protein OAT83_00450 [Gammaproteobacteria bacterium]|nr:hypothetical protein [Gammaproteobacteria bacterium]